jgi:hypothetical protein
MKQLILRSSLLFLSSLPILAQAETHPSITDKSGCKVANITPQKDESVSWKGQCKNGLAEGEGTLTWVRQSGKTNIYTGTMVKGYGDGFGRLVSENGMYVGEWKKGLQHGKGRHDLPDGSWYQGEWKDGYPHGRGQMLTPDGQLLNGYWNKGVPEDKGIPKD